MMWLQLDKNSRLTSLNLTSLKLNQLPPDLLANASDISQERTAGSPFSTSPC